jgi:hypothetical protein
MLRLRRRPQSFSSSAQLLFDHSQPEIVLKGEVYTQEATDSTCVGISAKGFRGLPLVKIVKKAPACFCLNCDIR